MGSLLVGHVAIGIGFLLTGLWHLFNHIKLHSLHPTTYISPPWFPTPKFRYLEPVLISIASFTYIVMELFISPSHHQPLNNDWSIPSYHLHNFEHSSISLIFLIYALFCIAFDRIYAHAHQPYVLLGLTQVIASVVFFQEWLLIHLHSTDHAGVEGQYHWLQQIVIIACFIATVISIGLPKSFIVSFVRSVSIAFQGVWFIVMAFALWSPGLIPKGCFLKLEDGRDVVRCKDEGSLERAKALAYLQFSWILALMVVFSVVFYLVLFKCYDVEEHVYVGLGKEDEDLESQRKFGESERCETWGVEMLMRNNT